VDGFLGAFPDVTRLPLVTPEMPAAVPG